MSESVEECEEEQENKTEISKTINEFSNFFINYSFLKNSGLWKSGFSLIMSKRVM